MGLLHSSSGSKTLSWHLGSETKSPLKGNHKTVFRRAPPAWLKISAEDVDENICKFAKKGLAPSQIGVILRDSHGIAQVRSVTGSKILRILKLMPRSTEVPRNEGMSSRAL